MTTKKAVYKTRQETKSAVSRFGDNGYDNAEAVPASENEPYPYTEGMSNYDEQELKERFQRAIISAQHAIQRAQSEMKQARIGLTNIKFRPFLKDVQKLVARLGEQMDETAEASLLTELLTSEIRNGLKSIAYERFIKPKKEAIAQMREERDQKPREATVSTGREDY